VLVIVLLLVLETVDYEHDYEQEHEVVFGCGLPAAVGIFRASRSQPSITPVTSAPCLGQNVKRHDPVRLPASAPESREFKRDSSGNPP
jgi:hypothetical protein